jgi:hypothetical protein
VSRGFKIFLAVLFVLFLLLFIPGGGPAGDALFALLFGWIRFVGQVLPKVTINPAGVGMALGCVVLAAVVGHRFCVWLRQGEPWRWRWTLAGLAGVVVLFAGATSGTRRRPSGRSPRRRPTSGATTATTTKSRISGERTSRASTR